MSFLSLRPACGLAAAGLALVGLCASAARAGNYDFTLIAAGTSAGAPSGTRFDLGFFPVLNASGTVAFTATRNSEDGTGIYTSSGGRLTTVAESATVEFGDFLALNSSGQVGFVAGNSEQGGFTGTSVHRGSRGNNFVTIASASSPAFSGQFFDTSVAINPDGTVAFLAGTPTTEGSNLTGVYAGSGGAVATLYDVGNSPAGQFGLLTGSGASDQLAFYGLTGPDNISLYRGTFGGGPLTSLAAFDNRPGGSEFGLISFPGINAGGTAVFTSGPAVAEDQTPVYTGLYTSGGGAPVKIADAGGPFREFSFGAMINAAGQVAFVATTDAGKTGLFAGTNPATDKVIQAGNTLFGLEVYGVYANGQGLNDAGQIALTVLLKEGDIPIPGGGTIPALRSAIVLATPTSGPGGDNGVRLDTFTPPSLLGTTQDNPLLPVEGTGANGPTGAFEFVDVPSGLWVDPTPVTGFDFAMAVGSLSLFTDILDFPTGFASPFSVLVDGISVGSFLPGQSYTFENGGVRAFSIRNILPPADADDPLSFPIRLAYSTPTASFSMRGVPGPQQTPGAIPEPGTVALLATGLLPLAGSALRRGRKA